MANRDYDRGWYGGRGSYGNRGFSGGDRYEEFDRGGNRDYDEAYGRGWSPGPHSVQSGGYLGGFGRGFGGANLGWGAGWGNAPYTGEFGAGGRPGWGGGVGGGWGGYGAGYGGAFDVGYAGGYGGEGRYGGRDRYGRDYDREERIHTAARPRGRGGHFGRGPRGYRRNDDRIREDINERLTWHPELDASDIEVRVENAEVTLTGVVEDRHAKRLAEDIAEDVPGINDVHNQLKVRHGFLAALLGEKVDDEDVERAREEREVPRTAAREGARAQAETGASRRAGGRAATANVR